MSYISYLDGEITYEDRNAFDAAVNFLETHDWLPEVETDSTTRTITIPLKTYRNLGRNLEALTANAINWCIIGASNDVSWHGTIDTPAESKEVDLKDWALTNGFGETEPSKDDYEDGDFEQAYMNWQSEVESAFLQQHSPN